MKPDKRFVEFLEDLRPNDPELIDEVIGGYMDLCESMDEDLNPIDEMSAVLKSKETFCEVLSNLMKDSKYGKQFKKDQQDEISDNGKSDYVKFIALKFNGSTGTISNFNKGVDQNTLEMHYQITPYDERTQLTIADANTIESNIQGQLDSDEVLSSSKFLGGATVSVSNVPTGSAIGTIVVYLHDIQKLLKLKRIKEIFNVKRRVTIGLGHQEYSSIMRTLICVSKYVAASV